MKRKLVILLLFGTGLLVAQCQSTTTTKEVEDSQLKEIIQPVPISSEGIDNFNYPEDSNIINKWIMAEDDKAIAQHGWGIWTALNKQTNQKYDGQDIRVFETWLTPEDMQTLLSQVQIQLQLKSLLLNFVNSYYS